MAARTPGVSLAVGTLGLLVAAETLDSGLVLAAVVTSGSSTAAGTSGSSVLAGTLSIAGRRHAGLAEAVQQQRIRGGKGVAGGRPLFIPSKAMSHLEPPFFQNWGHFDALEGPGPMSTIRTL